APGGRGHRDLDQASARSRARFAGGCRAHGGPALPGRPDPGRGVRGGALVLGVADPDRDGRRSDARGGLAAHPADSRHLLDRGGRALGLDGGDAGLVIAIVVRPQPWWEPQYVITITG